MAKSKKREDDGRKGIFVRVDSVLLKAVRIKMIEENGEKNLGELVTDLFRKWVFSEPISPSSV